jgi:hypothetical protein
MYSTEHIFSPLDREHGVPTEFTVGPDRHENALPSTYIKSHVLSQNPRRISILRKPVPVYDKLPMTDSFLSTQTETVTEMEKEKVEVAAAVNRGWRFYGAFACLALLNLVCAIDATILSVALPVISPQFSQLSSC